MKAATNVFRRLDGKAEYGQFFLLNFIYCVNNFVSLLGVSGESCLFFLF